MSSKIDRNAMDLQVLPADVLHVMRRLSRGCFEVWLVGGAVRDLLLERVPKDWDLATTATPQDVMALFARVIPVGIRYRTVKVLTETGEVEVTSVEGAGKEGILTDLGRRDFTMNALALAFPSGELLDPYRGCRDLRRLTLRGVGEARSRFREDPLRTLRAGRFLSVYGARIERGTFEALKSEAAGLGQVAGERIREEILKMLLGEHCLEGFEAMRKGRVLQEVLPELLEGFKKKGNDSGDLYRHALEAVRLSPRRQRVRLAALFHDIGKPRVRQGKRGAFTFPGHREEGCRIALEVMERWKMSRKEMQDVQLLVAHHLPVAVEQWSGAAVRHLIARVGPELLDDLVDLACADRRARSGSAASLDAAERLRFQIAEELERKPPLGIRDLSLSGREIMEALHLPPGPQVGRILRSLLDRVLENPDLNERKILLEFAKREYHSTT